MHKFISRDQPSQVPHYACHAEKSQERATRHGLDRWRLHLPISVGALIGDIGFNGETMMMTMSKKKINIFKQTHPNWQIILSVNN